LFPQLHDATGRFDLVDDSDTEIRYWHRAIKDKRGRIDPAAKPDERLSVTIREDETPWPIRLYFATPEGADTPFAPGAPLVGVEFGDEDSRGQLDLADVERVARNLAFYEHYARAMIQWDHGEADKAAEMLSFLGAGRRSLPPGFFKIVAADYNARRRAGEKAPITAIARNRGVYKSTVSRWVAEAKKRNLIRDEA
jgi:hypothetical protein